MDKLPSLSETPIVALLAAVFDGALVAAPGPWRIVYVNPSLERWLGRAAADLRGQPLETVFGVESWVAVSTLTDQCWRTSEAQTLTAANLCKNGPRTVDVRICRIEFEGTPLLVVIIHLPNKPADAEMVVEQRRDPLTELYDREFLLTRLETLLRGERSADRQFAVLFVDLDNFKQVNDEHGHLMGDRVLREVARRLAGCVREGDDVVRFGGDEFVVLVERVTGHDEVEPVIERIRAALARPIALPHGEFTLSLSIGVAVASPEHHSAEDLLHDADRAMYAAKRSGNKS